MFLHPLSDDDNEVWFCMSVRLSDDDNGVWFCISVGLSDILRTDFLSFARATTTRIYELDPSFSFFSDSSATRESSTVGSSASMEPSNFRCPITNDCSNDIVADKKSTMMTTMKMTTTTPWECGKLNTLQETTDGVNDVRPGSEESIVSTPVQSVRGTDDMMDDGNVGRTL